MPSPLGKGDPIAQLAKKLSRNSKLGRKILRSKVGQRYFPILVLADKDVRAWAVGGAARLGNESIERRQKMRGFPKAIEEAKNASLAIPELFFAVVANGFDAVDAYSDTHAPGALNAILDIPEEKLRDAARTLSDVSHALRTGVAPKGRY